MGELGTVWESVSETHCSFVLPALLSLLPTPPQSISEAVSLALARFQNCEDERATSQRQINDISFTLYGLKGDDRVVLQDGLMGAMSSEASSDEENEPVSHLLPKPSALCEDVLSYAVGAAVGRWDLRLACGEHVRSTESPIVAAASSFAWQLFYRSVWLHF